MAKKKTKIERSVGKGGKNDAADVRFVQEQLNLFSKTLGYTRLKVDGSCKSKTSNAILAFQRAVLPEGKEDGKIAPGKQTERALKLSPSAVNKKLDEKQKGQTQDFLRKVLHQLAADQKKLVARLQRQAVAMAEAVKESKKHLGPGMDSDRNLTEHQLLVLGDLDETLAEMVRLLGQEPVGIMPPPNRVPADLLEKQAPRTMSWFSFLEDRKLTFARLHKAYTGTPPPKIPAAVNAIGQELKSFASSLKQLTSKSQAELK